MKYYDEHWEVRMLIAEKQHFKGMENYFIDTILYEDILETSREPTRKSYDSDNEIDFEPK